MHGGPPPEWNQHVGQRPRHEGGPVERLARRFVSFLTVRRGEEPPFIETGPGTVIASPLSDLDKAGSSSFKPREELFDSLSEAAPPDHPERN